MLVVYTVNIRFGLISFPFFTVFRGESQHSSRTFWNLLQSPAFSNRQYLRHATVYKRFALQSDLRRLYFCHKITDKAKILWHSGIVRVNSKNFTTSARCQ